MRMVLIKIATTRKPIDVSGFDSLVTDFNSNWYYADTISDDSFVGIFWDDTVFSYTYEYDSSIEALDRLRNKSV